MRRDNKIRGGYIKRSFRTRVFKFSKILGINGHKRKTHDGKKAKS